MNALTNIFDFLKTVLFKTGEQLIWLLGLLFVFGLLLYLFARMTRITYAKTIGQQFDVYFTGWLGTPIHEIGHAIFCLLFGHKITEMKLFSPNSTDNTIGYVNHSYNSKSIYQRIGNFFIGVGPILFGALVLYLLSVLLMPQTKQIFHGIEIQGVSILKKDFQGIFEVISSFWNAINSFLSTLFVKQNLTSYKFWIYIYLITSISSHMQLSPSDIKGAASGLLSIVIFFLIINLIIIGLERLGLNNFFGDW